MKKTFWYLLAAIAPTWAQTPVSPTINALPTREFGQLQLISPITSAVPNLVEGRELNAPQSIAFDTSVTPPIMYVADTSNNRVLAFKSTARLGSGNAADLVIGQRDLSSTFPSGPGTGLSTGLAFPSAVAVDSKGNLYVADAGNNRILRYPTPFSQPSGSLLPVDLIIGQKGISTGNQPNQGLSLPSNQTIALSAGGNIFQSGLAIDSTGNLWFCDAGNNRILRYPVANIQPNSAQPAADVVLGQQASFITNTGVTATTTLPAALNGAGLYQPSGLTFDSAGNLYVADGGNQFSRVLYFPGPVSNGGVATRIAGIVVRLQGEPVVTYPNQRSLGISGNLIHSAAGVFTDGTNLFVCDTGAHRVLKFGPGSSWPDPASFATVQPGPQASSVLGQVGFFSGQANKGQTQVDNSTLSFPVAGAFTGAEMWIVDSGNNRVLGFPLDSTGTYSTAQVVVGQLDFIYNSVNLIEGREVFFSNIYGGGGGLSAAGIVIDKNSNPPHLYVADTNNHRILGFNDVRNIQQGQQADIVIGQPNFKTALVNYPGGLATSPNKNGLNSPVGLVVDASGNLYVADAGNGRVVRFPSPFSQPAGALQAANLVLGQISLTSLTQDASNQTMHTTFGLAQFSDGSLAVSDSFHNRVLFFKKPAGGDFPQPATASIVFGQKDFNSIAPSTAVNLSGMNSPRHMATDTSDRLFVCDSQNNRVMVFSNAPGSSNGASSQFQINNLSTPQGVSVSSLTGEIWITDTGSNRIGRYPEYTQLLLNPTQVNALIGSSTPLAVTLDTSDNLVVAEATNRVTFYYAQLGATHAATNDTVASTAASGIAVAPGTLVLLSRQGLAFNLTITNGVPFSGGTYADGSGQNPWPTVLNDISILVNGTLAPIFHVLPFRIDFQIPQNAPTSGTADFVVFHPSTGEIVGVGTFQMARSSPGFFTGNATGSGQAAATNEDGTVNGPGNEVARGHVITFYLTGAGVVPGAPPDGAPPSGAPATPQLPVMLSAAFSGGPAGLGSLPSANILYSGLGAFAGGWQINMMVPQTVPPSPNITIALSYLDVSSNIGPQGPNGPKLVVTFAVK